MLLRYRSPVLRNARAPRASVWWPKRNRWPL